MPKYDYLCETNQQTVEVIHSIHETLSTWGEVCARLGKDPGATPAEAPVRRLISKVSVNIPVSDSHLKSMGFTKLVKREKGVYENVTAHDKEKRFMVAGDATSLPDFKRRITD